MINESIPVERGVCQGGKIQAARVKAMASLDKAGLAQSRDARCPVQLSVGLWLDVVRVDEPQGVLSGGDREPRRETLAKKMNN